MGCYLAPDDASTVEGVIAAIGKQPQGAALLVVGNFITNLAAPEVQDQDEGIAAALAEEDLDDMRDHFRPRNEPWLKDGHTWDMRRGGRDVRFWTDFILYPDSPLFQNKTVRDARHNTDHYLVLGCLPGVEPGTHSLYLVKRTRSPIRPPDTPYKSY